MKLVCAMLLLVACGKSDESAAKSKQLDTAKLEKAKLQVGKYAFEAYPMWSMKNPDKACPAKLAELDEFAEKDAGPDPWGNALIMKCGPDLPAGAKGIAISSNGPDGKPDTADDIKSWAK